MGGSMIRTLWEKVKPDSAQQVWRMIAVLWGLAALVTLMTTDAGETIVAIGFVLLMLRACMA
jgi:hypothetical protein